MHPLTSEHRLRGTGVRSPLRGQFVPRQDDPCVCLGGKRQDCGSLVGFVAHKTRSLDAHEQTDFVNDRVEHLFGRHAPGEERGDAPKRGLLGLDLREMRISSGAIRCHWPRLVTALATDSDLPKSLACPVISNVT